VLVTARFVVAAESNTHLFALTTDYKLAVDFTVKAELKPLKVTEKLSGVVPRDSVGTIM
jgi:hypothetical protein